MSKSKRWKQPFAKCGCRKTYNGVDHDSGCECTGYREPDETGDSATEDPAKEEEKKDGDNTEENR
jgi:hypothetical protein